MSALTQTRLYLTEDAHLVPLASIRKAEGFSCRKLLPRGTAPDWGSLVDLPHGGYRVPNSSAGHDHLHGPRPPAVDLYAGGGGLLYGVHQHFEVQHAVEMEPPACATLRDNFPQLKVHQCAVNHFTSGPSRPAPGSVALLVAGPPWFVLARPSQG